MNKQHFLLTLNKWKQEKNLARLVYRIIKFEEDDLLSLQKEKLNKLNHKYNIVFQNNNILLS